MSIPASFATIGGNRIAYRLEGRQQAPVLVLASSLGTTNEIFDAQMPAFASRFRVLRYDLRGHGSSAAPDGPYTIEMLGEDLLGLLDHLHVERASICGLSLGGMIAMWVAANQPERLERLVLACTSAIFPTPESWAQRAAAARALGVGALSEVLFPRWFTGDFRDRHPDVLAKVAAMLESCDPEGYAACCEAIARTDLSDDLSRIEAPTLVVAGAEDPASPPDRCLELAQAIEAGPGSATLVVLAEAAHLANVAHPVRFADLVVDHLLGPAFERGMAIRRAVLGDAHVDRASANSGFGELYQDFITRYAWGEVWARPGLDRRTRSAITVAMLVALGRFEELSFHLRAAIRNGWSLAELEEILLQTAVYAGVPAAQRAFHVARQALGELAELGDPPSPERGDREVSTLEGAGDKPRNGDFVQSLERGLAVIRAFGPGRARLTLTEVAHASGLTRAAARRFLLTLVELGYVRSDGASSRFDPRVLELGYAFLSGLSLPEVAQPVIEDLVAEVHESSSISVLDGTEIVYIVRVPTHRIMTVMISVGTRFPAYCTSMGRVLLAARGEAELEEYLSAVRLQPRTPWTITDRDELQEILEKVRAQGFAVVEQELEEGLSSLAVPLHDASGSVIAAMNVSANSFRLDAEALIRELLPPLQDAAVHIEEGLRSRPGSRRK